MSESQPRRIVALGECMIELREEPGAGPEGRPAGALVSAFAGDTLNVATYLRRLLPRPRFKVDYFTALGDDPFSDRMLQSWRAEGIGTTLVRRLAGELPGIYWISNGPDGERAFSYWRENSAARRMLRDEGVWLTPTLGGGDLLYFSLISLAILPKDDRRRLLAEVDGLRRRGVRIACDGNYRPRLWSSPAEAASVVERVLSEVDVFITSTDDEAALFGDRSPGDTARRLTDHEVPEWVVRGEPGVTITREDGLTSVAVPDPGCVVDTTGAGDAFDAAYLSARLLGRDTAAAVQAGHGLAQRVVQHRGAILPAAAMPSLDSLLSG